MKYVMLWLICLSFAGVFLYMEAKKKHLAGVCLKGLASLSFVLLGILTSKQSQNTTLARNVLSGLYLGMIADILLNLRYLFPNGGQLVFLIGILVFLAGHVMYIIALIPLCSILMPCLGVGVVLTAVLIWRIFRLITAKPAFKIFGVFYLGAIMLMTSIACGILITKPSVFSGCFAAGALLFLASDIILILNTFGSQAKESLRISNIVLYYVGQLLIAQSLLFI